MRAFMTFVSVFILFTFWDGYATFDRGQWVIAVAVTPFFGFFIFVSILQWVTPKE